MAQMTPEQAEFLARGYAWGYTDGAAGFGTSGWIPTGSVLEGIRFAEAFRKHVENGHGSRLSIQRAYIMWKDTNTLPNV